MTHVAVLVGSLRADSVNRQIAESLRELAPAGTVIDIVDGLGDLPFYNEDLDGDGVADVVTRVRDRVAGADRVLAVTPEYNATMPAVLNNAIDWLSRPYGVGALAGKPFGGIGVPPTPYGGPGAHAAARRSVKIAGAIVVEDVDVSQTSIDVDVLNDPDVQERLRDALATLVAFDPDAVSSAA